jgi:putative ABC transport system permease protein
LFFVLAESLAIALIGGFLGLVLAWVAVPGLAKALNGILPSLVLSNVMLGLGLILAVLVGFISGIIPGVLAMRMRVVNALRRV